MGEQRWHARDANQDSGQSQFSYEPLLGAAGLGGVTKATRDRR